MDCIETNFTFLPETLHDPTKIEELKILPPDHPLLQQFQKTLEEHLLRIQNQLLFDIKNLDTGIKTREQERETIGSELYDLQQEIRKQNDTINDFSRKIQETNEKCASEDSKIEILRRKYEEHCRIDKESKAYYKSRQMELTNLESLEFNIKNWSKEIDDEVAKAKRIASKDKQDQKQIAEEKKKMDLLLFNLSSEVMKKEQELGVINEQIKEQKDLIEVLNGSLADANSDLEAYQKEQKRLTQAWNEVIVAINKRDKILLQTRERLKEEHDNQCVTETAIEGTKKAISKEMEQNEKLEAFKQRIMEDFKRLEEQVERKVIASSKIQWKLDETEALMKQTDDDLTRAKQEENSLMIELRSFETRLEREIRKKQKLEDEIFKFYENQIISDNAYKQNMKELKEIKNERRHIEGEMTIIENKLANIIYELEILKGSNFDLQQESNKLQKQYDDIQKEADFFDHEIVKIRKELEIKTKSCDLLQRKLNEAVNAVGGKEMSAIELKIANTQRQIQETNKEIQNVQAQWLNQQEKMIQMSEKRASQIKDIQLIRKHDMIVRQKTLKINDILKEKLSHGQEIQREIKNLMKQLDLLSVKLYEKKKSQEREEEQCLFAQVDQMDKLKEAKLSVLRLEQAINETTKDIEQLKQNVLEKHHEALSWESKYKMVENMIRWRNEEKSSDSDIGHMKMEIRRMTLRYNQLKRAQQKLIRDLDSCVMHREKIFLTAIYRQKCEISEAAVRSCRQDNTDSLMKSNSYTTRSQVQRKINECKNKIEHIQNEIKLTEKKFTELLSNQEGILQDIDRKKEILENERLQCNEIENEIEQSVLKKYNNLEIIVEKQRRAKRYRELEICKNLPKLKPEIVIESEYNKQLELNDNLREILQKLLDDYSEKKFEFTRMLQTLQVD